MSATAILTPAAAAEAVCHEEQLRIWADDHVISALAQEGYFRDDLSYDDRIDIERIVMREIKNIIESAFDHPEARTIRRRPFTAPSEGHSASPVEDCSDQARNDRLFELDQPYDAETTDGWNPISTAPKDGPAFLVWVPENKCIYEVIARDSNLSIFGGGFRDNLWRATHWMPLPTPPSHPSTQSLRQEG